MPRLNESTQHSRMAPSIACGAGSIVSGTPFAPISTVVWLNVTTAGNVTFHTLDGNSVVVAFPVGFFVLDIQCDTLTFGAGVAAWAFANPL